MELQTLQKLIADLEADTDFTSGRITVDTDPDDDSRFITEIDRELYSNYLFYSEAEEEIKAIFKGIELGRA